MGAIRRAIMGYKSVLRSMAAEARRQEREAKRKQHEIERQRKNLEKMQDLERSRFEVLEYENYIEVITSVHRECGSSWDWRDVHNRPEPREPQRQSFTDRETRARRAFAEYTPGRADRLMRRVDSRRKELAIAIESAKTQDDDDFSSTLNEYKQKHIEWEALHELSGRILSGNTGAFVDAIKMIDSFSEVGELGSHLRFITEDGQTFEVTVHVNGEDIIPSESKSLLKSGKLSIKKITKTKYYEIYQDHVCSAALRIGRELFALLPAEMAIITATSDLLNTSTGHIEEQPILSVAMPRSTIERLNFDALDPSDSMENFVHNMKFLKTKGFQAIGKISKTDLASETIDN
jgi:hypothetical protein